MAKFNKFLLIKFLKKIYVYNLINNIDLNKNKIDYIL